MKGPAEGALEDPRIPCRDPTTPTALTCRSASTIKLSILFCKWMFRGMPG